MPRVLGGVRFLVSEIPLYLVGPARRAETRFSGPLPSQERTPYLRILVYVVMYDSG